MCYFKSILNTMTFENDRNILIVAFPILNLRNKRFLFYEYFLSLLNMFIFQ